MIAKTRFLVLTALLASAASAAGAENDGPAGPLQPRPLLFRKIQVPEEFLTTAGGVTFGGDLRIGDLDGDGQCELLVYRCEHGAPRGAHVGGMKPVFLGAFDLDGRPLWKQGKGGNQPSRPMSVAVHDMLGDGAAEVICFWRRPRPNVTADWRSLADVVVEIRDGRNGRVLREAAPPEITSRRMKDPQGSNWVHQRLLVANFRGTPKPRDLLVKLGDTYVALDDELQVLWTYRTEWVEYSRCPAYTPAVGDLDGDGRSEVNGGYFVLRPDGTPIWQRRLGPNMDSVAVAPWDDGRMRAICSGSGQVLDAEGNAVLRLGAELVPHGQEVRVGEVLDDEPGPEMVLRWNGHNPDVYVVTSTTGRIVRRLKLNSSPTNVGMEIVAWNGPDRAGLLYNGGWLWDLDRDVGEPLPGLPPPGGGDVHRMGFYHAIAADVCGDRREELVVWDPTASSVYVYTPAPLDEDAYSGYHPGPRQYNPRLMD